MKKINTYTLNSLTYIQTAGGCEVILAGWRNVGQVLIPTWGISHVLPHWWVGIQWNSQSVDDDIYAPPAGGWALSQRN